MPEEERPNRPNFKGDAKLLLGKEQVLSGPQQQCIQFAIVRSLKVL
jgi:hypothetical protein